MDLLEATEEKIVRKVDGQDCTFSFLTAYDRAELLRADLERRKAAHQKRRERFIENLKLSGISGGPEMLSELEAFEDREPKEVTEQDWIALVNDPIAAESIFAASLKAAHNGQAETLAKRVRLSMLDKAKICGLDVVTQAAEKPESDADPNTFPPVTYGTPAESSTSTPPAAESSTTTPA